MIRETMIDAEALDLKLLNIMMKCIEEAVEVGNLFDNNDENLI